MISRFSTLILACIASVSVAGCGGGGGGSSSTGGGGSTATVGTFSGGFTITISAPGSSVVDSGPITMVVQADGVVVRDPATDGSSASLSGNSFTITNGAAQFLNDASLSCIGTIAQNGTVEPGRVTGTFTSSGLSCNGIAFSLQGTFTTEFANP